MSVHPPPREPTSLSPLAAIERPARRAERRIRLGRALERGTTGLAGACLLVAVLLVLRKTGHLHEATTRAGLVLAALLVLTSGLVAYLRPLPLRAGAVALDRFHRLSDRLASALSFGQLRRQERSPFMNAAIEDALSLAGTLDPNQAVPFHPPRDGLAALGFAIAALAILVFEVRAHVPDHPAQTIEPVDITADDVDAMRDFLRDVQQKDSNEEVRAATLEFNQLINDLAARHLDRTEAFRRMQALEDKLLEGRDADPKSLEEALKKIGEAMKKAELTKPAGEALENKNLIDAHRRLNDLAKKLREQGANIDKSQLEKMRDALKAASKDADKRQAEIAKRRDELEKELLQQKKNTPDGGASEQEKSLLQKRERELERLNRETAQQDQMQRQLDRLDRELAQAAEDLMKDLGLSAKDLEQGAEDINRMAREEMTQEEKEQLRQKLEELREMLRQQGQGGQQQRVRLRRFQSHAKGQGGQGGQGQDGQEPQGDGKEGQGQQGDGSNGQGQAGKGQGNQKQSGQHGGSGETWIVGPNGEKIMMLSQGRSQQGPSGQDPGNGGKGDGPPNPHGWGTGHDGKLQGGATNPKVGTEDSQVAGQDTGQGQSRSEVIQGAAERGFASRRYTSVYQEYHSVAEEALNKDEIPGGYRSYVRRYFQLIRPRDEPK